MNDLPQIPGYTLIKRLGRGGMADVYLGLQENLVRKVAIKIMAPALFRDEHSSKRFIKEAQTAAQLVHPGIVTVHDVGQVGETYYIVMEYLEESLKDRIKQVRSFPPGDALKIIRKVASALDYAHKRGFVHRDIKPDNIMFRADGTPVLVDFGIARAMDSSTQLTRTGTSIGTPHYMSPEQCLGEKIDGRSDIYSLGVVLFELLAGNVPYRAENTTGVILKHIQEPVPRLPGDLGKYQYLIDSLMAKDKKTRFQGATEVVKCLEAFTANPDLIPLPVPKTASGLPAKVRDATTATKIDKTAVVRPGEPKKLLLPLIAVIVLAAIVATWFLFIKPKEPVLKEAVPPVVQDQLAKEEKQDKTVDTQTVQNQKKPADSGADSKPVEEKKIPAPGTEKGKKSVLPVEDKQLPPGRSSLDKKEEVASVNLLDLSPEIRKEYNGQIQSIHITLAKPGCSARGTAVLDLSINEYGRMSVRNLEEQLTVDPPQQKQYVTDIITQEMNGLKFSPPRDKAGKPARLSSWRVVFKVGTYQDRITLTKK